MSVRVTLTWDELILAAHVGVRRRLMALVKQRPQTYGYDGDDAWTLDVEAAASEMAVAKHLRCYWMPLTSGDLRDLPGDVGPYQVRSTKLRSGCLIAHHSDPDDRRLYLVISHTPPVYEIAGWTIGRDAKHAGFWRADVREPAFFVPRDELRDVNEDVAA